MKSLFLVPLSCLFKWFLAIEWSRLCFLTANFCLKNSSHLGFSCAGSSCLCISVCIFGNILHFWEYSEIFVYLIAISLYRTSSSDWIVGWLSVIVNAIKTCHRELSCPVYLNRGSVINPDISETQINGKNKMTVEKAHVSLQDLFHIYVKDWSNKCHSKENESRFTNDLMCSVFAFLDLFLFLDYLKF